MQLPDVTLTAAGSDREINLARLGVPAVLICHGQNTAQAAMDVNQAVRQAHPDPAEVVIASVIDLRSFPSMFRGMVKPELEKAYARAAGKVPAGAEPADFVVLLPDWDGSLTDGLGVSGSTDSAAVLVAAADGRVLGVRQNEDLAAGAVELLAGI